MAPTDDTSAALAKFDPLSNPLEHLSVAHPIRKFACNSVHFALPDGM